MVDRRSANRGSGSPRFRRFPKPRFPPLGLTAKLIIGAILIALPSFVIAIIGDLTILQERQTEVPQADRAIADTVGAIVEGSLDEALAVGWALATGPVARSLDPRLLDPWLQELETVYPQYDNIVVVDSRGQSVGEMAPRAPGEPRPNLSSQSFVSETLAMNQPHIGGILTNPRLPRSPIPVAVPVRDARGKAIGAVVVVVKGESLGQRLANVPLTYSRLIVVTDSTGALAYTSAPPSFTLPRDLSSVPLIRDAITRGAAIQPSGTFGPLPGNWLGVAIATPRYHWIVAVIQPVDSATAPITQAIVLDLLSFGLVLALVIVAALFVSSRILGPIRALEEAARAWSRGDFSRRVDIRTGDELETLGNTFNRMATSLAATLSQLQETDQRLEAEGSRLRAILNTSPAGIVVIDQTYRVVLINPAARILGEPERPTHPISESDVVGRVFRPDGTPYRLADLPLVRALREGVTIAGTEVVIRRPNGWDLHVMVNAAPIRDEKGAVVGAVAIFFDVTPLAEEERLRSELVISAAHEFRNPLTVIKGYAEVAMRDPTIQDSPVYRDLVRIVDAANRVARLADELLRAAELHLPPLVLHTEVIDLASLVAATVERFRGMNQANQYQIEIRARPARVEGDPELLSEAVGNLLRQAEAAMPHGGTIEVQVSVWDGIATVAVTDHGPVVPPERIAALFQPFAVVTAETSSTLSPRPSLLLYLTRRIIEESGGWMRAQSSPAGTTISFTLPRYPPHDASLAEPGHGEQALSPEDREVPAPVDGVAQPVEPGRSS